MMRKKIDVTDGDTSEETSLPGNLPADEPDFSEQINAPSDGLPNAAGEERDQTGARDYITALQAEMEEMRARLEDAEKRALYSQSEFQNFRRRRDEEQRDLQKFMNRELITGLLPIVDNFERALAAAEQSNSFDSLIAGVRGTQKQLQTFLEKAGVKVIEAHGKPFDPNYHEAISHAEDEGMPANTVAEEVQKGYIMHDKVLRPTLVKVSQG